MKCKIPPVQSHEIPNVNLCEDNDIHFSKGQNIARDELAKESNCVPIDRVDVVNILDGREFVISEIESGNTGTNIAGSSNIRGNKLLMLNVGEHSSYNKKVIFEET